MQSAIYRVSGDTSGHVDAQTPAARSGVRIRGRRRPRRQEDAAVRAAAARRAADGAGPVGRNDSSTRPCCGVPAWATSAPRQAAAASSPATTFSRHRRSTSATGKVERHAADALNDAAGARRQLPLRRHRRPLLHRHRRGCRPGARGVQAADAAGARRDAARARLVRAHLAAGAAERAVLRRAEAVRRAARRGRRARPRHQLRHVRVAGRAAAEHAEVAVRVRGQLRLVDHHAHDHPEPGDVSAAAQERRRDEEDADGAAADAGDSEALLASEDDRPGRGRR